MNRQLEIRLAADFPNVYGKIDRTHELSQDAICAWGVQAGNGWYGILRTLGTAIDAACRASGERAVQIKEKFGTLRVYLESTKPDTEPKMNVRHEGGSLLSFHPVSRDEATKALVNAAIEKSSTTCERCGSPGSIIKINFLIAVRCDDCASTESPKVSGDKLVVERLIRNVIQPHHPHEVEAWRSILDSVE